MKDLETSVKKVGRAETTDCERSTENKKTKALEKREASGQNVCPRVLNPAYG